MNMIVTGGYGFIGSNFIRYMLGKYPDLHIYNIDKLSLVSNDKNLDDLIERHHFEHLDLSSDWSEITIQRMIENLRPEWVVHFAAESHVDTSISAPRKFLQQNVVGTHHLLEGIRLAGFRTKLLHISTDEVYGSLSLSTDPDMKQSFMEHDQFEPSSPYAASKAAAEMFVHAYGKTYNVPYIITRCSNNYGPNQHPEKFIPKIITNVLRGVIIPVYGTGVNERDWIHVRDNCRAIDKLLTHGMVGEAYNIGSDNAVSNMQIVSYILTEMNVSDDLIQHVPDRLGHDLKYKNDWFKIHELGWRPHINLRVGLEETIKWYINNEWFWK